jgi:hypothetical protein
MRLEAPADEFDAALDRWLSLEDELDVFNALREGLGAS